MVRALASKVRALASKARALASEARALASQTALSSDNSVLRSAQPRQPGVAASTSADRLILLLPLVSMATSTGDTARGGSEKCGGCPRSWLFPFGLFAKLVTSMPHRQDRLRYF